MSTGNKKTRKLDAEIEGLEKDWEMLDYMIGSGAYEYDADIAANQKKTCALSSKKRKIEAMIPEKLKALKQQSTKKFSNSTEVNDTL